MVLFIGTVILAINTDFTEPVLGWRFFEGNFYLGYSIVLDVLGLALLAGVVMMMVRRAIIRPRKLDYARPDRDTDERSGYRIGDWTFVGILLILVVSGYVLEGARIAMDQPGYNEFSPAGWAVAQGFDDRRERRCAASRAARDLVVARTACARAFVSAIPYTKASHMLASFGSLVVRDPLAGKRLRAIPPSSPPSRPATARSRTSAACTCSNSTPARSAASATRPVRRSPPAGRCRRATWCSSCASRPTTPCARSASAACWAC